MDWCDDEYEPECEGETCQKWGTCAYSKALIKDDPGLRKTPIRRRKMKKEVQKKRTKKSVWKPIEFMAGEHGALDAQVFTAKCEDPRFVAQCLAENLAWRRGQGRYKFSADPKKNKPMPLCPRALSIVEEAAIQFLKSYAQIHAYHKGAGK